MRPGAKSKLGFYPLPAVEAERLRRLLSFPSQFSALDPCVGDGAAFTELVRDSSAIRYAIEIDAYRTEQARSLGISVLQADIMEVRCPAEALSLVYLNPPYDFESGKTNNRRLEVVFLEHVHRWLKPAGILILVIPQRYLQNCGRLLAEHFTNVCVYRLTDPECLRFNQIAVLAVRRRRTQRAGDAEVGEALRSFTAMALDENLPRLSDQAEAAYVVPLSEPVVLSSLGIPLDELEDALLSSSAYRQVARVLLREQNRVSGRPLTPLHGGHVGLLCTAGMLNGVFGEGPDRHIAHWRSVKFVYHWEEEDEDGTKILHDRERFSHELTLIYSSGRTHILTHAKEELP